MLHLIEEWRPVVGHEGAYEVSSFARVRSLDREWTQVSRTGTMHAHRVKGRLLRPGRMTAGHLSVMLGRGVGSRTVHSLVTEAFIGPRPAGLEVRHLDGDQGNNLLGNLCYDTRSENGRDKKYHAGQRGYRLTPAAAREVKARIKRGDTGASIAADFGLAQSTVSAIKHGRFHVRAD